MTSLQKNNATEYHRIMYHVGECPFSISQKLNDLKLLKGTFLYVLCVKRAILSQQSYHQCRPRFSVFTTEMQIENTVPFQQMQGCVIRHHMAFKVNDLLQVNQGCILDSQLSSCSHICLIGPNTRYVFLQNKNKNLLLVLKTLNTKYH